MDMISELLRYAQVALGIGLVIFVHEAGHFIAARLCGVRVETFSLGFGPALFTWRRGFTAYQIALVPLGGFVKMAGDEIERQYDPDLPPRDWELGSKSVPQRFLIYSGGVLMNLAFACVVFPLVLLSGLPSNEPIVGATDPGSPAWHARFPEGSRVITVNGKSVFDFFHIPNEVALSGRMPVTFEVLAPGEETTREITLNPEYVDNPGIYQVGIRAALDEQRRIVVAPDSPAARAGLSTNDRLISVDGPWAGMAIDRQLGLAYQSGEPVTLVVADASGERRVLIEPERTRDESTRMLGVEIARDTIEDLRDGAEVEALGLAVLDRIHSVAGVAVHRGDEWTRALLDAGDQPFEVVVERGGRLVSLAAPAMSHEQRRALALDGSLSSAERRIFVAASPNGGALAAGLQDGDEIVAIGGQEVSAWGDFQRIARQLIRREGPIDVEVSRASFAASGAAAPSSHHVLTITPRALERSVYGVSLRPAEYVYQASSFGQAISVGVGSSWRLLVETWRTLRKMLTGEVSAENLGGIVTIGVVSNTFAEKGLAKLFFFLCMLSVNLALLNVLPIPVLDGGHLFFLLVEGIKGSPVSERTLGYSQIVGLVLILSLMVYVTYNDVARWFFS